MWITNLSGNKASEFQFYIAGAAAVLLGLYSFALPACKTTKLISKDSSLVEVLGLNAFKLFGNYKMALFLHILYVFRRCFTVNQCLWRCILSEFENFPKYADSFM